MRENKSVLKYSNTETSCLQSVGCLNKVKGKTFIDNELIGFDGMKLSFDSISHTDIIGKGHLWISLEKDGNALL